MVVDDVLLLLPLLLLPNALVLEVVASVTEFVDAVVAREVMFTAIGAPLEEFFSMLCVCDAQTEKKAKQNTSVTFCLSVLSSPAPSSSFSSLSASLFPSSPLSYLTDFLSCCFLFMSIAGMMSEDRTPLFCLRCFFAVSVCAWVGVCVERRERSQHLTCVRVNCSHYVIVIVKSMTYCSLLPTSSGAHQAPLCIKT